ncbi:multicopper oxidase [Scytonema sp. NUACC26]
MATAGVGAAILAPAILKAKRTQAALSDMKFTEPLPTPFAGSPLTTLTIASSTHSFHSSLGEGSTFGYGGTSYLGPTFEVSRGTQLTMTAVNNLEPHPLAGSIDTRLHGALEADKTNIRVSLHLHGSNTAEKSDGYPSDTFTPGQTYTYNFVNNQEAATLWYHDHALGITRQNVMSGLAGVYLIRDTDDPIGGDGPLGLPAGAPYEIPLVLQDRSFNPDGSIFYPPAPWQVEFLGDVATVNGKAWPNLNVDRTVYRFRIVNASNARTYNLKLSSNQAIVQIGTDAGFFNAPVQLTRLLLAPGERADVLIDFSNNLPSDKIVLENEAASPFPFGRANILTGSTFLTEIMQFTVNQGAANPKPIPEKLRLNKPLVNIQLIKTQVVRQRYLTLVEIGGPTGVSVVLLNNVYWDEAENYPDLMEQPKVNTVEQWNIINLQPVAHPLHLHLVSFLILNRQKIDTAQYMKAYLSTGPRKVRTHHEPLGGPTVPTSYPPPDPTPFIVGPERFPAPNERGWKDTVIVYPGEITRLIVPFGASAAENIPFGNSFTGRFVWHCHMLEHEDNEMMLPFEVIQ